MDLRSRLKRLRIRLEEYYGEPSRPVLDPVDELILTVLSQNTSDVNSHRAFGALKNTFPRWEDIPSAPTERLADLIRVGGLAHIKAPRIRDILLEIERREGETSLDCLHAMSQPEAEEYLTSLPGVGPKTAACVLLFSLGRPAFPVDTHVLRVAVRLELASPEATAEAAHRILGEAVASEDALSLHLNLVRHGRTFCKALRPRCRECPLLDESPYGQSLLRGDTSSPS